MDIYDAIIAKALDITPFPSSTTLEELMMFHSVPGSVRSCFNAELNKINASLGGKAKAAKKYPAWNKGVSTPRSKESIEKQRVSITGKKRGPYNYNHAVKSTAVVFRGKEYPSIDAARKDTGASFYTIKKRQPFQQPVLTP